MAINMKMGGVPVAPPAGVLQSINQTGVTQSANARAAGAQEVGAIKGGPQNKIGTDLIDDSMRVWKEERLEGRQIAQEGRKAKSDKGVLEESRTWEEKQRKAKDTRMLDPASAEGVAEKSRLAKEGASTDLSTAQAEYYRSGKDANKAGSKPSQFIGKDGNVLTIDQAKLVQKEIENQDPDTISRARATARTAVKNQMLTDDTLEENSWLSSDSTDVDDFIDLYTINPEAAKTKDPDAYKIVHKALKGHKVITGIQEMINSKIGGVTPSKPKRTKATIMAEIAAKKAQLAAQQGK